MNRYVYAAARVVRCPVCHRWWNRHDPLIIHGDGVTDDLRAIQHAIDNGLPWPVGRTMRVRQRGDRP